LYIFLSIIRDKASLEDRCRQTMSDPTVSETEILVSEAETDAAAPSHDAAASDATPTEGGAACDDPPTICPQEHRRSLQQTVQQQGRELRRKAQRESRSSPAPAVCRRILEGGRPRQAAAVGSADPETGWGPKEKRRYFRSVCPGLESIDGVPMYGIDFFPSTRWRGKERSTAKLFNSRHHELRERWTSAELFQTMVGVNLPPSSEKERLPWRCERVGNIVVGLSLAKKRNRPSYRRVALMESLGWVLQIFNIFFRQSQFPLPSFVYTAQIAAIPFSRSKFLSDFDEFWSRFIRYPGVSMNLTVDKTNVHAFRQISPTMNIQNDRD
jgi:hypothetical protein